MLVNQDTFYGNLKKDFKVALHVGFVSAKEMEEARIEGKASKSIKIEANKASRFRICISKHIQFTLYN